MSNVHNNSIKVKERGQSFVWKEIKKKDWGGSDEMMRAQFLLKVKEEL